MAKDFPEYTFAVADEEDFATELKDLGLSESGEEVNAAILDEGGRRFAMEPIKKFVYFSLQPGKLRIIRKARLIEKKIQKLHFIYTSK